MEDDKPKCNLKWICNTLLKTYNTSILDISDEMFKEACVKEAKQCAEDNKDTKKLDRKVLSQLILNHSNESEPSVPANKKKPVTDYIGGPRILRMLWSKRYKKIIYIFGERHNKITNCESSFGKGINHMLIEDYLEQLFKNTDVFIDFYLETGRTYEDSYGEQRIAVMAKRFKDCFHNPKKIETMNNCALGRMHYFDIRSMHYLDISPEDGLKSNPMSYVNHPLNRLNIVLSNLHSQDIFDIQKTFQKYFLKYEKDIMPILKRFSEINTDTSEEYEKFWYKEIEEHTFLAKKVLKSNINDKIKSFIVKEIINSKIDDNIIDIKTFIETTKSFITAIENFKDTKGIYNFGNAKEDDFETIKDQITFILSRTNILNSCIADYYLLSRIFKNFNLKEDSKSPRMTDEPVEPHNIIIYAGEFHAKRARKFLKKRGFKDIDSSELSNLPSNCVNIKSFKQPFFSNREEIKWYDDDNEYDSNDDYEDPIEKKIEIDISDDDLYG